MICRTNEVGSAAALGQQPHRSSSGRERLFAHCVRKRPLADHQTARCRLSEGHPHKQLQARRGTVFHKAPKPLLERLPYSDTRRGGKRFAGLKRERGTAFTKHRERLRAISRCQMRG